jgi:hypothetical protein
MKLDPGMHIVMHLVFLGETSVTGGRRPAGSEDLLLFPCSGANPKLTGSRAWGRRRTGKRGAPARGILRDPTARPHHRISSRGVGEV